MNEGHQKGRWEAQTEDAARLATTLQGMIDTGELPLNLARQIYAGVHGTDESEEVFGKDPQIENIINGRFGQP